MAGIDRAGWEDVLATLVAERGDALARYAYVLCGDPDEAADLVQAGLVATFGRLRNGFAIDRAEAYVRKAIASTYIDRGRRASRWRATAHLYVTPDAAEGPDVETDRRIDLKQQLAGLSPRERACVVLRYYGDQKVDDIAAELGISSGAVKRYLSDGLTKLASALTNSGREHYGQLR